MNDNKLWSNSISQNSKNKHIIFNFLSQNNRKFLPLVLLLFHSTLWQNIWIKHSDQFTEIS